MYSIKPLETNYYDEQDPNNYKDGMIYSIDKSGIFNLYLDTEDKKGYVTNVLGGAFMPSVSNDGKILYSLYENASYSIAILDSINIIPEDKVGYSNYEFEYPSYNDKISNINYNKSKKYKTQMSKLSFMPKIFPLMPTINYTIQKQCLRPGPYLCHRQRIHG